MKKKFAAVFCSALALTSTLCFGGTALADEPLKIEFFQQKGEEGPQKGYKAIIEKFNEENPDIEIKLTTVPSNEEYRSGCRHRSYLQNFIR